MPFASRFSRPAVFQLAWIGDQLLGLPAIRAICAGASTNAQLLLGAGMLSFYYRGLPFGEPVRVRWDDPETVRLDRLAGASTCDAFFCLSRHPLPFTTKLARALGATCTIGFGPMFDEPVRIEPGTHVLDQLFAVPRALDPSLVLEPFCSPPVFSPTAESAAARYVDRVRESCPRILFVHPETGPHKSWPAERFAWAISRFLSARPEYIAIVSSLAPVAYAGSGTRRCLRIDCHLELAMAIVRHADLFLGVDSCFLHAADLYRVPGVGLFGPTDVREWGFRLASPSRHVTAASMDDLDAGRVLDALLDVAAQAPLSRAASR